MLFFSICHRSFVNIATLVCHRSLFAHNVCVHTLIRPMLAQHVWNNTFYFTFYFDFLFRLEFEWQIWPTFGLTLYCPDEELYVWYFVIERLAPTATFSFTRLYLERHCVLLSSQVHKKLILILSLVISHAAVYLIWKYFQSHSFS